MLLKWVCNHSGNEKKNVPLTIEFMLAVLNDSGKLSEVLKLQNTLSSFGGKKSAILFIRNWKKIYVDLTHHKDQYL